MPITGKLYSLELRRKHFLCFVTLRKHTTFLEYLEAKDEGRIFLRKVGNSSKTFMLSCLRNFYDQNLSQGFNFHGLVLLL